MTEGQGWFLAVRGLCSRQKRSLFIEQAALEHDRSSRWGGIGLSIILVLSVTHSLVLNELLSQNLIPTVLVLPFVTPLETQTQEQVIRPHERLGIPQRASLGCLEGSGGTTEADRPCFLTQTLFSPDFDMGRPTSH